MTHNNQLAVFGSSLIRAFLQTVLTVVLMLLLQCCVRRRRLSVFWL